MRAVSSMTGFAAREGSAGGNAFAVTIKSVNHRVLDLAIRVPRSLDAMESALRGLLKQRLKRGHVELTVTVEMVGAERSMRLNRDLLTAYAGVWRDAAAVLKLEVEFQVHELLRMPGVVTTGNGVLLPRDSALEDAVLAASAEAVTALHEARTAEGRTLALELDAVSRRLRDLVEAAAPLREKAMEAQHAKIRLRMAEITGLEADPSRILLEAALIADRGDVDEELVRLRTHIDRLRELLTEGGEVGRPLDFLLQELMREANTLLAKSGNCGETGLAMTDLGLRMKVEIERAREQVQNLE